MNAFNKFKIFQGTSKEELKFFYYIKKVFSDTENRYRIQTKKSKRNFFEIDIFVPSHKIAIEYDGVLYHNRKEIIERDKVKNKVFSKKGIHLIRIREKGLLKIWKYEFEATPDRKKKFSETLILVLDHIKNNFKLTKKQLLTIEEIKNSDFQDDTEMYKFCRIVNRENSLAIKNIKISKEWHPTKNEDLTPNHIMPSSCIEVWWKCNKCNNEWVATPHDRNRGWKNCVKCKSLGKHNPKLIKEWSKIKNKEKTIFDFTKGSSKIVWWNCKKGHNYEMSINNKSKKKGCPYCSSAKIHVDNSLKTTNSKLAKEWHSTLNKDKTPETVFASSRTEKAWWECSKNKEHVWEAKIHTRHHGNQGCPYCAGKKVSKENSLYENRPDLSSQWHPTKNEKLTPKEVTKNSGKRVWWECIKCNHEWESNINNRNRTSGKCPSCKK